MKSCPQPPWNAPLHQRSPLRIYNSLTRQKDVFSVKGNRVGWYKNKRQFYQKARAYMTFDIVRRIMTAHFGYSVFYVMNITDVDDKIIIGARYKHLFEVFASSNPIVSPLVKTTLEAALARYTRDKLGLEDGAALSTAIRDAADPKRELYLSLATRASSAIKEAEMGHASGKVLAACKDVLAAHLDAFHGATLNDPALFRDFAAEWEAAYFTDMDALGIQRPDVLTRVSEYVPEIVASIERIIDNGFAYESSGSVYFNTVKFDQTPGFSYAKLEPWSASDVKKMQEGEGDLSVGEGRRNKADFVLWKTSKPGEPGRPGWHIECTAMASDVLGSNMDIHSGGIDLAFPHHDNELAQSEAMHKCPQWVNYFMHAGHLHIEGMKMSKSLKNFVTIQDALKKHSAAHIRIMFLLHSWDAVLDFKDSAMAEARDFEVRVNNFMATCAALRRAQSYSFNGSHTYNSHEKALIDQFHAKQEAVHEALCDSFDTPLAMQTLRDIVVLTNTYLQSEKAASRQPSIQIIDIVTKYIAHMFSVFGIESAQASTANESSENVLRVAQAMSLFRDKIRRLAQQGDSANAVLEACDMLRDFDLLELGIVLDDQPDGVALVKVMDKESVLRIRDEKRAKEELKMSEKASRLRIEEEKKMDKLRRGSVKPLDLFRSDLYSQWDKDGFPTHEADGTEVNKSRRKKIQKEMDAHVKLHAEYLVFISSGGSLIE